MFVNRTTELNFLNSAFARASAEFLVLYGRRRMGKTALLQELSLRSTIPTLYHVAAQTTRTDELRRFSERLAVFFKDDVLTLQPLVSWEAALAYLTQQAQRRPFGLLLDEFPYAVESDRSLPSLLQAAWDRDLSRTGIKLVLCGSSIGMMERICLLPQGPLFGRRTGQWKLEPFGPEELGLIRPAGNLADLLRVYGVMGGCPQYVARMDAAKNLEENIRDLVLSKGAMLYEEVPFLLRAELREPHVYQSILSAVAGGACKFAELSSKTGLDRAHLTRYLSILIGLDLLEREVPVTEVNPAKSRRGIYRIRDPFVAFWYRFVFPNRDRLEGGQADSVLSDTVLPGLDAHLSRVLEPVIGKLLKTRWRDSVPFDIAFSGRHWADQEELDWLALDRERRQAVAAEIKWTQKPVSARQIAAELDRSISNCKALQSCTVTPMIISRNGYTDIPPGSWRGVLIDLQKETLRGT